MAKTDILVVGTHPEILQTILRLINANEQWQGTGALNVQQAVAEFKLCEYKLVLLGAGLTDEAEDHLCDILRALKPHITIVKHYGGGSGLLFAEIQGALGKL